MKKSLLVILLAASPLALALTNEQKQYLQGYMGSDEPLAKMHKMRGIERF